MILLIKALWEGLILLLEGVWKALIDREVEKEVDKVIPISPSGKKKGKKKKKH